MTYNYGPKDTTAFVVNYGFVPHKNTIDRTPFAASKEDLMFLFWKNTVMEHRSKEAELEMIRMMDGVVSRMISEVSQMIGREEAGAFIGTLDDANAQQPNPLGMRRLP